MKKRGSAKPHDEIKKECDAARVILVNEVNDVLALFRICAKKGARDYPERLRKMGVFSDPAFTSFLFRFREAAMILGPEYADRIEKECPETKAKPHQCLNMEAFSRIVSSGLLTTMLSCGLTQDEVERVKANMDNEAVASFLFEYAEFLISREQRDMVCGG